MATATTARLIARDDLPPGQDRSFALAVLGGLAGRPRSVPARYFYDEPGSRLFERITALPEYYPTRTETALLEAHGATIAQLAGHGRVVVEFGSGASTKTPLLLGPLAPAAYVPIDISGEFLREAAAALRAGHPGLRVWPVEADFTRPVALPGELRGQPTLGFFPGSTIGNFTHREAADLLRALRATLEADAWMVIGIDLRKDAARLVPAYDDAAGVTAAFNRNLLHRINRELDGSIPVERFAHVARWNAELGRIEMHLQAEADLTFTVLGRRFALAAGETIHTENSYKYTSEEARLLARVAGWVPVREWSDPDRLFAVHLWHAGPEHPEP